MMNAFPHENASRLAVVECRDVWKIFGDPSPEALAAVRSGRYDKESLLKQYGCVTAVTGATFSVAEGETFCIIGLSGSGKSTLIRHFNRLIEPTSGEVIVRGQNICALPHHALRKLRATTIAMVFQQVALLPYRTVLQNVMLPLEVQGLSSAESRSRSLNAIEKVGLASWADRYPRELSGGMQQRVGIARALAADAEVLLMDEPFSALDPLIRKQLQIEFKQLSTQLKKTTIFITHDIEEAIRIGDRIAIMREGRIVQIGTPEEIALSPVDDYVASFVEGISRLKLVKAHSVMQPQMGGMAPTSLSADVSADLETLIDMSLSAGVDAITITEQGSAVGVVTREAVLKAVRGIDVRRERSSALAAG